MGNAMLEVKDISKSYHGKKVVDHVSFTVDKGQIMGLVGSNGAGKSTCLKMIATIIKADSGEIVFDGCNVLNAPADLRKHMGYVPQDIALYETLSGRDNLRFWGRSYGVPAERLNDESARVCEIIGFSEEMLKKRVSEYSGGMKRRLNIGVALLHNPDLVILDEPTAGIDIESGNQILDAIEELRAAGKAVIYVGHYMEEVERISTHLCILNRGRCVGTGSMDELLGNGEQRISLTKLYEQLCLNGRKE